MAKINIMGVKRGSQNYTIHIVVTEPQDIEGEIENVPIGEALITISHTLEAADIKDRIVDAAKGVMDAHKDAENKRRDIEEFEFPEIT